MRILTLACHALSRSQLYETYRRQLFGTVELPAR